MQDADRPLSDLGRQQAKRVASFMARNALTVDTILCSPLLRAQETAEPFRVHFSKAAFATSELLASSTRPKPLLAEIAKHSSGSMLLVGHDPILSTLLSSLVSGDDAFKAEFGKATLALVQSSGTLQINRCHLSWLMPVAFMPHH